MDQPIRAYLGHLADHGIRFTVRPDLEREPDHDGPLLDDLRSPLTHTELGEPPLIEHFDLATGLGSDHATWSVARVLHRHAADLADRTLLELGCGTGLLAVLGARAGAHTVGTDVDPRMLELARKNVAANTVTADLRAGSVCAPLGPGDTFDWCVANLPHKPAPAASGLPVGQDGGPEGDAVFGSAMGCIPGHQPPGGRLLFFLHSLPNPRLLAAVGEAYALGLESWKLRWLGADEYGDAVRERFRRRHAEGTSFLWREGGREALVCGVWLGRRRSSA